MASAKNPGYCRTRFDSVDIIAALLQANELQRVDGVADVCYDIAYSQSPSTMFARVWQRLARRYSLVDDT